MAREIYSLVFSPEMAERPILQSVGKRFRLAVTLRRAMLNEEGGWAEVQLDGPA